MIAAASSPSPLWFVTRATGAVSLLLLTVAVVVGVAHVGRIRIGDMPRFVVDSVHRSASLLAVCFIVVHVLTSVLDGFAPITPLDAVVPLTSAYRPLWLGLGAVAFDLVIAVTVTSLLRRRLGYSAWRATHWVAYASWPVALVHGLGTGTDTRTGWMLALSAACMAVVLAAVVLRVSAGWPRHRAVRLSTLGTAALVPIGLLVWMPTGPLATGWAKRAGTPAALLASARAASAGAGTTPSQPPGSRPTASSRGARATSFSAQANGRIRQLQLPNGLLVVDISVTMPGHRLSHLGIRIEGAPIAGGGVQMSTSRVTLGPPSNPGSYLGRVTALQGTEVAADLADRTGTRLSLVASLQIAPGPGTVAGSVTVSPGRSP
jgi:sulfoxide reductase heme-binding subunit YedZ